MSNEAATTIAIALFFGLVVNGVLSGTRVRLDEYQIIDEAALSAGLAKAACLYSGGTKYNYREECEREDSSDD